MATEGDRPATFGTGGGGVDFFVSYTQVDRVWAEWVAWQLEDAGYRVVVQAWDFGVGSHFVHEMHKAASDAARTVAVLSAAYLTSAYAEAEWQAAWAADPSGGGRRLVAVRVEDCPRPGLLGQLVGVDLFGLEQADARRLLLAAVAAGRRKPDGPPDFPGAVDAVRTPPRFPGPFRVRGVWEPGRSPFPGLAAFDASRALVFQGREQEIRQLAGRLARPAGDADGLMVVVGPSGCGKSSLVAAGLGPALADDPDWLVVAPMAPGGRPVPSLAGVLAAAGRRHGLDWDAETLTARLTEPGRAGPVVTELLAAAAPARRLLLVVDQAEELLVRASRADQARFMALLAEVTTGPVRAVATLRSEYLDRLLETATPAGLRVRAEALAPLSRDLLPLVITGPSRMAGLAIDDELVVRMAADTGDGQSLPLLAYTLQRLYVAARETSTTVLSAALYEQIGGVRGSLVDHADAALADATAATGHAGAEVLATLLRLVTVDAEGRPTRRRIPLDQLPDAARGELTPFVARRLLVVDAALGGPATVEVAHERLLTAWPPLAGAITQASDRLRQRGQAETAAEEWEGHGRPASRLWNLALASGALATVSADELTPMARRFLTTSRRRARRRLTSAFAILTVLLLLASGLGLTAYVQGRNAAQERNTAEERRRTTVANQLLTLADNARDTDPLGALRLAAAAHGIAPRDHQPRAGGNILDTLTDIPALRSTIIDQSPTAAVALGPGGLLAVGTLGGDYGASNGVWLWDTSDPDHPRSLGELLPRDGPVNALAFGPGGLLAVGGFDSASDDDSGVVRLWDTTDPGHPRQLGKHLLPDGPVNSMAFGPGGLLATGSGYDGGGGGVWLWDTSDPDRLRQLGEPLRRDGPVNAVAFGPDGLLAAASFDRDSADASSDAIWLWDTSDPDDPRQLGEPLRRDGPVNAVAFGPDGLLA
ncbi:TIR domain-containing protein, partial [Frankia sp. CN7]